MADKYTVVQHSGFGYAGDLQFRYGLESRHLPNQRTIEKVKKAGGVVLDGYTKAEDAAELWMYAPGSKSLIPSCKQYGTFSIKKVDGLAIFIPSDEARGMVK